MAEEAKEEKKPEGEKAPSKPKDLVLILGLVNTVAVIAVLGLLVYTKLIYKKPKITEETERPKIEEEFNAKKTVRPEDKVLMSFEAIQANLKPTPIGVQVPGGPPPQLKPHTLTMNFSLELSDAKYRGMIDEIAPKFKDGLLRELGGMTVDELTTVQGRYILRSKIAGIMNEIMRKKKNEPPAVLNVYFSEFLVQ